MSSVKILGINAYGSIPHLSLSKTLDATDKRISYGQERILTVKKRDRKDVIIVSEKVDGSCVSVCKIDGQVFALTRAGYHAWSSPYKQHIMFHNWVYIKNNMDRFHDMLGEGERIVGEWMAQTHGTRYDLPHEPFIAFDIFNKQNERICYLDFLNRCNKYDIVTTKLVSYGMPISIQDAYDIAKVSGHGAIDKVEGVVWRVEREGKVDFLGKYVIPDKEDGKYLFGDEEIWNKINGVDVLEVLGV